MQQAVSIVLGSAGVTPAVFGLWPKTFRRANKEPSHAVRARKEHSARRRLLRPGRSRSPSRGVCSGFSLVEVLVAVGLIAVIMLALVAMLNQTQRAFRGSIAQVDVMEAGRSLTDLFRTDMLDITNPGDPNGAAFLVVESFGYPGLVQQLPSGGTRDNILQDFFFLARPNPDEWIGTAYIVTGVSNGAGTLERFTTNWPVATELVTYMHKVLSGNVNPVFHRVADGIVHLRVDALDKDGYMVANVTPNWAEYAMTNQVPARVEVEIGVLELKEWERLQGLSGASARAYLANKAERVHLFRQTVPVHSAQ